MSLQHLFLRRLAMFFLLCGLTIATTGCNIGQDTNQTLYTELIGIDKSPNGKISVTYQFENLKTTEDDTDKASAKSGIKAIHIEGENIYRTIEFLSAIVSRTPSFAHVRAVIFGEEIAREGILEFLTLFLRFNEFRSSAYILVVNNGTAREFIANNKPTIEASASKYIETQMALSKYTNIFLKSNIHEFYNRLKSNSAAPYAALGGININKEKEVADETAQLTSIGSSNEVYAGEIPRMGTVNPAEFAGTALFRQDKMVGKLSSQETLIASIFRKDFKRCVVQVDDPFAPGYHVDVMLRLENAPPQIKVGFKAGKAKIDVKLDFICGLNNIPSGVSYEKEEYKKELEKVIAAAMLGKIQGMLEKCRSMGADLVGFGYNARGQFKTYPEFMAVKWDELYSQAEIDVKVAVKVKNSGLMRTATSF